MATWLCPTQVAEKVPWKNCHSQTTLCYTPDQCKTVNSMAKHLIRMKQCAVLQCLIINLRRSAKNGWLWDFSIQLQSVSRVRRLQCGWFCLLCGVYILHVAVVTGLTEKATLSPIHPSPSSLYRSWRKTRLQVLAVGLNQHSYLMYLNKHKGCCCVS